MITALSLNPSIDMTISVNKFTYGGLNRVQTARRDAGGKGLNVAIALRAMGAEAECIGFMHEENAKLFEDKLAVSGATWDFVYCPGSTRTNIKLRDDETMTITELNQSGRAVTKEEMGKMMDVIRSHAEKSDYMVLTGSVPPGCDAGVYRDIIEELASTGCRCVLDADGEKLAQGLKAKPFLIKPNRYELELLTGRSLETRDELLNAADELIAGGIGVVAISLGGEGALITDGNEALFAPPLKIEINSTVGAGDSMVAGLTAAFAEGKTLEEAFRIGVACASAACCTEGTQVFTRWDFEKILEMVKCEHVR